MRKAFTLMELIVFIAIFSLVIVSLITIFVAMINLQTSQTATAQVNQESQFLLQQLQYYISSARLVDMPQDVPANTLVLRAFSSSADPTSIMASGSVAYVQVGAGNAWQALTSNKVSISGISFTRHFNASTSSAAFGTDSVSFSFTLSATSTNGTHYTQSFESSVAALKPVGKIAMIQQASVANPGPVGLLTVAYPTNNETSSLLIAVVTNSTPGSASVSDTAGNTWQSAGSIAYGGYNNLLSVFYAMNAESSPNTVSVSFSGGSNYGSLFIYEYRGASTASSLDVLSAQLQPANAEPSSGLAHATSTVELLLGATYNGSTSEIPSPGSGYTLETSSTLTHVFVEDTTQYVTGPVGASWQYAGAPPDSSAIIAAFK